jgi:hypothetical protein
MTTNRAPRQYRKKPVVIEAFGPLDGHNIQDIADWSGGRRAYAAPSPLIIDTLEGAMSVGEGDYVIKGVHGEFYPCKPDIFEATYENVDWVDEDNAGNLLN